MPKSYTVVINSLYSTSGAVNTNKQYYIDWSSIMPKGEYELKFSYVGEGNVIPSLSSLPLIYCDFLSAANVDAVQTGFQATSSLFLGCVFPQTINVNNHTAYFRADQNFNSPIYLANRPYNNDFNISILTNDNPPVPYVDENSPTPSSIGSYVLVMNFRLLKEHQ